MAHEFLDSTPENDAGRALGKRMDKNVDKSVEATILADAQQLQSYDGTGC